MRLRALALAAMLSLPGVASAELTKPPKLVTFVEAPFPAGESAPAKVVLQLTIGADGKVTEVLVKTSGGAAFDAAATDAVKKFVFEPAEIDGKPAAIKILYEYAFTLKEVKKTTADFGGVVRDRKDKSPLANVTITVGEKTVVTDANGKFELKDLPPGKITIALSGERLTGLQTEETLEEGKRTDVVYDVTPKEVGGKKEDEDDYEIVVTAPPLQKSAVSTEVAADQGRKIPGTSGDVVKVVDSMPGVARSAAGSGALVVWGAAPRDTRVYFDGVRIPMLYHLGGVRSVLAGDLVKSIELVPGGYGAAYGRGLGGIVLVAGKPLEGDGTHGSAAVDIIDASASMRTKIADHWRVAVAARRSHLDSVVAGFTDRDVGELFPIPRYWDGQFRIARDQDLEIGGLMSSDTVDRVVASPDPARVRRDRREVDFLRLWVKYKKELADGAVVSVVPFVGTDRGSNTDTYGSVATELAVQSQMVGLRASHRVRATKALTTTIGLDGEVISSGYTRFGSIALPAREGDVRVFGAPPPDRVNADSWRTVVATLAPYGELDFAAFDDKLHVIPGLRLDPYVTTVSRKTPLEGDTPEVGLSTFDLAVEPRLTVRYAASDRVRLHAAWGQYRQPAEGEDLSAVFGNPALPPSRATHYVLGGAFKWTKDLSVEITAFHSRSRSLAVRSPLSSPLLAEALVPDGEGRVTGAQLLLRKELSARMFGWIGWTILRSERRDRVDGAWRPFDYDQSHVINAVASYDLGRGFEFGARMRYATGFPRTPVYGATYDARRDVYQPTFGRVNSTRLPAFFQVDVRLAKRVKLGGGSELEAYVDVQNVTNRANAEEVVYDQTFTRKGFLRGVPVLPVVGARVTW